MRSIFLFFLFFILLSLTAFAQRAVNNPVSLGPIIVDQPELRQMADVCEWYQFTEQPSDDGYRTFRSDDGTEIIFNISPDASGYDTPYVEIRTSKSKKSIEKTLTDIGFQKDGDHYIKGNRHAIRYTSCRILGNTTKRVIFTKEDGDPMLTGK